MVVEALGGTRVFHKAGSSSVQQSPSVYSYRGGRKSGDGVEGNLGDAGSISQTTDGWGACPYGTSLSAVTLNVHKGQIIPKRSKVPPPPPPRLYLYPPTSPPPDHMVILRIR